MKDQLKSYEKFSYYLHLIFENNGMDQASGCCVSYRSKTYLLTNYHVIPGWNPQLRKLMNGVGVKTVHIQNPKSITGKFGTYGFDTNYVARNVSNIFFLDQPDIMLLEFDATKLPANFELNIIDLDNLTPLDRVSSEIFAIGFPGNLNVSGRHQPTAKNSLIIHGNYLDDHSDLNRLGIKFPNSTPGLDIIKSRYQAFQFYFQGEAPGGMSGAPAFFLKKGDAENPEVEFAGLISGGYVNAGYAVGIKREVIIYYLDLMQKYGLRFLDYNKLKNHSYHEDTAK